MIATVTILAALGLSPAVDGPDYVREVKPILTRRCVACHGALQQKSGLRADTAGGLRAGGDSGPAIEPGRPDESYLIELIAGGGPVRMPPEGEPLTSAEVETIRAWIAGGAGSPDDERPQEDPRSHWAFRPPDRAPLPPNSDRAWARNPIDVWIAAARDAKGLGPAPEADRATLLRRVSLDLTGLAPSPDEVRAFESDPAPDAYEEAVERLLASTAYGERWGRHWLDVWRYSDWDGFGQEVRESQPYIWRWRDWAVESLNADKPYDRMVAEMLAGDELAPDDPDTLRATGYLARNWYRFNRNVWLDLTIEHMGKAFLGVTFNCARCHDHKYDPISQLDYYRLRAIFEPHDVRTDPPPGRAETAGDGLVRVQDARPDAPTYLFQRGDEKEPDKDRPLSPAVPSVLGVLPTPEPIALPPRAFALGLREEVRRDLRAKADAAVEQARAAVDSATNDVVAARPGSSEADRAARLRDAAVAALAAAVAERQSLAARIAADDLRYAEAHDTKHAEIEAYRATEAERRARLLRAEADRLQKAHDLAAVQEKAATGDGMAKGQIDALRKAAEMAEAAVDQARTAAIKPARDYSPVAVVHPSTSTGRRTSLARWITDRANPLTARVAVNHVWARHFGRPLVETVSNLGTSGARPSHPELLDWLAVEFMDSGWSLKHLHRLIVTSATYRMASSHADSAAEAIDPNNLAYWRMNPRRLEAELVRDNLLLASGILDRTPGGPDLDPAIGMTSPRRSLYFRHAKEKRVTFLKLFDSANVTSCYRRDVSIVPQQALALANSALALGEARRLAGSLAREHPDASGFVAAAFARVLGRAPNDGERSACLTFLADQTCRLSDAAALTAFAEGPDPSISPSADPAQRARESLVLVLFNHHDFVTIR
jgi:mono/diheme cytochrome c family protein